MVLPQALADRGLAFVGRARELAVLAERWRAARSGQPCTILLSGEAGVGKTRLAGALAQHASSDAATVLYGRCDPDLGVPYQPFIEALRAPVATASADALHHVLGPAVTHLARLAPELATRIPADDGALRADPEGERYLLFESVRRFLEALAEQRPVLLVIDDIHWAAEPTLLLLHHLVEQCSDRAPLAIVATFREDEAMADDLVSAVTTHDRTVHLSLTGIDRGAVGELVVAGDEWLADLLYDSTEGNPFFLGELVRHLSAAEKIAPRGSRWSASVTFDDVGLPDGVREVVGVRLARLPAETVRVLTVASVIGPSFTADALDSVLAEVGDRAVINAALADGVRARVIIEEESPATYVFTHALVRQVLYRSSSATRRVRLHRVVGEALERMAPTPGVLMALAHHFAEAAAEDGGERAAAYAYRAAREALDSLAFEAAASILQRALAVLRDDAQLDRRQRAELLLLLAQARQSGGDLIGCREAASLAAEDARATKNAEQLARAAILHAELSVVGTPNFLSKTLCEDALTNLSDEQHGGLRARVAAALVFHRVWAESEGFTAAADAAEVVEDARRSGDPEALADALHVHAVSLIGSDEPQIQLAVTNELLMLADDLRHGHRREQALQVRASARLRLGDVDGFDADASALEALGRQHRSWNALAYAAQWRGARALLEGRFADVPALADEVLLHGSRYPDYFNVYAAQFFMLNRELGQFDDFRAGLVDAATQSPGVVAFQTALALTDAEVGEHDAARARLHTLLADDLAAIPRDVTWSGSLFSLVETAAVLGDEVAAGVLADLLRPQSGMLIVIALGLACPSAVDRHLGMLATVQGRHDDADRWFGSAIALETRIGSPPLIARSQYWWARSRLARGERADDLLTPARRTAARLGMAKLVQQIDALS